MCNGGGTGGPLAQSRPFTRRVRRRGPIVSSNSGKRRHQESAPHRTCVVQAHGACLGLFPRKRDRHRYRYTYSSQAMEGGDDRLAACAARLHPWRGQRSPLDMGEATVSSFVPHTHSPSTTKLNGHIFRVGILLADKSANMAAKAEDVMRSEAQRALDANDDLNCPGFESSRVSETACACAGRQTADGKGPSRFRPVRGPWILTRMQRTTSSGLCAYPPGH